MNPFSRHPFDPAGHVKARRQLVMGERTYESGQELSAADAAQLAPRLGAFYDQGLIDTVPRAPSPLQGKQAQPPARR